MKEFKAGSLNNFREKEINRAQFVFFGFLALHSSIHSAECVCKCACVCGFVSPLCCTAIQCIKHTSVIPNTFSFFSTSVRVLNERKMWSVFTELLVRRDHKQAIS